MKNKYIVLCALFAASPLLADEEVGYRENTPEWIDAAGIDTDGKIIILDTPQGIAFLKVLQFDAENNRYLVDSVPR